MAMPSNGCLRLRDCITGIACSSISCGVVGIACSPASLAGLSVQAGKSAPHAMTEFYGYSDIKAIDYGLVSYNGGDGTIGSCRVLCVQSTPSLVAGNAFNMDIDLSMNVPTTSDDYSFAKTCVVCNSTTIYNCTIYNTTGRVDNFVSVDVYYGDSVVIHSEACAGNDIACAGSVCSEVFSTYLANISGTYCFGTNTCYCSYTG